MTPIVPKDATVRSIMTVYRACGWFDPKYGVHLALEGQTRLENPFGLRSIKISERLLGGTISSSDLLCWHSQAGIWGSFFSGEDELLWLTSLAAGDVRARHLIMTFALGGMTSVGIARICPECILSDLDRFGFGHWHLFHQLPFIQKCSIHDQQLRFRCEACRSSHGFIPAHVECPICRDGKNYEFERSRRYTSAGYVKTVRLLEQIYAGTAPLLRPRDRHKLCHLAFGVETDEASLNNLLAEFIDWFGALSFEGLERTLFSNTGRGQVKTALAGLPSRLPVAIQAAVSAFALERAPADWADKPLVEGVQSAGSDISAAAQCALEVSLDHGFPACTIAQLMLGDSRQEAARILNVSKNALFLLESKFPAETQALICDRRLAARSPAAIKRVPRGRAAYFQRRRAGIGARKEARARALPQRILVARHDALILKESGLTRSQISDVRYTLYDFLINNDLDWLNVNIPCSLRRLKELDDVRKHYRETFSKRRAKDPKFKMNQLPAHVIDWLRKYDRDWLMSQFPKRVYRDFEEKRSRLRELASESIKTQALSPSGVPKLLSAAQWQWLMSHDRPWIEDCYNVMRRPRRRAK